MIYLIDGHNLLHKFRKIKHRIHSDHLFVRDFLITELNIYFKDKINSQIYLYFDNRTHQSNLKQQIRGIHIRYSPPHQLADDLIKNDVRQFYSQQDRIIVISDDRGITDVVRGGNVYVKSAAEFYSLLLKPASKHAKPLLKAENTDSGQLTDREVDKWLDIFNADDSDKVQ